MIDISKQIKIEKLREKLTSQLQKIIINNEKFHTIKVFKTLMIQVNLKLNNIIYNKQNNKNNKKKNSRKQRVFSKQYQSKNF